MQDTLRFEQKFSLTSRESAECQQYIRRVLWEDRYCKGEESAGYLVRSLYFEPWHPDEKEKDENLDRPKIRLRVYSPHVDWALFEVKTGEGLLRRKRSFQITREEAQSAADGNYEFLQELPHVFAKEIYALMTQKEYRPKSLSEHRRRAYMIDFNDTRVLFDSKQRSCHDPRCIFEEKPPFIQGMDPSFVVMELKYRRFLLGYVHELIKVANASRLFVEK